MVARLSEGYELQSWVGSLDWSMIPGLGPGERGFKSHPTHYGFFGFQWKTLQLPILVSMIIYEVAT